MLPLLNLNKNETGACVTVCDLLFCILVNICRSFIIFSQLRPVKVFNCSSDNEKSLMLPCNDKSILIDNWFNNKDSSDTSIEQRIYEMNITQL